MISTDKAIEPVSMLGLTKRFAEMYCQALDHEVASRSDGKPRMRLISVRFGNVLASNGSVVPKFKAQIEAGGPVTVTHPDMVRYFMTIREACDLVITAATHALAPVRPDVSVYVLNMGQPVKIVELAERMIRLSGLQPGHDIEIAFTGMRQGERLNEILFTHQEPSIEIGIAGVMAAKPNEPPMRALRKWIEALKQAIEQDDRAAIEEVLKDASLNSVQFRQSKRLRELILFYDFREHCYRCRENWCSTKATAMLPTATKRMLVADEWVMVDAIANAARPTLSAKTSLTMRNTVRPLSVAC